MCKKTKCMIFRRQQKHIRDFNVCIDNTVIERVESFNYLGIMLSETLSWKSHIGTVGKIFPPPPPPYTCTQMIHYSSIAVKYMTINK